MKKISLLLLMSLLGITFLTVGCTAYEEKGLCSYLGGCGGDDDGEEDSSSPSKNKTPDTGQ